VASLLVLGLASGCMWVRENRRAEAARAAERERESERDGGQHLSVDIDVHRHEGQRAASASDTREPRRDGARATASDVTSAMIAPEECPMLGDAEVSLVDLGDGAALEFIAADDGEVQIVRDRVLNIAVKHQRAMQESLAEASSRGSESEAGPKRGAGQPGRQTRSMPDLDPMPASHVAVVDVDRGARIIFVPVDRSDLDRLNEALEERARYMRQGSCPANLMSMQIPDDDFPG
jgi:hypothetical protein